MDTIHKFNDEEYVFPEIEVLQITIQSRIMDTSPTGGDDTTEPNIPGDTHNW